ncbi:hypothetical protein N7510_000042 [Penicillium lagena]|uniref:uncharacterized protein n=1 Tax=Penicillium lagena TaxID=94218 RepID=UPI00253FDBB2|nr:uncharacterized protein N7510_000042 [Penicillium lagena]KAJ5623733.1 hypothetical protein N7510_000042 [Penicillium lagena]
MFHVLAVSGILYLLWTCLSIIRTLYLHPLRNLPGPHLWIAFPILRYISLVRGRLDMDMRAFHNKYGEAVRFGPDEVSFITAQAWKDIYAHGHGDRQFLKVLHSTSNPSDIISANNADHSRFRRALSHAFSAKGLQAQEPILRSYVDKLIQRLEEIAASPNPVANMVKWYNLTTFDLIGDLAFGEPFGGLDSSEYHYWVANIFQAVRGIAYVKMRDAYPLLSRALSLFLAPKSLLEARKRQIEYSKFTVQKRLQSTLHRGPADFMDSMLRHSGDKEKELTDKEMEANANILIIAGSETTATLLSGVTYWLLRTPDALHKATHEVRSSIPSDSDITFQTTSQLPYMLACLNEALRVYPPAPGGLERITIPPSPADISGYMIPHGTKVSIHQSAAYCSPLNFHRPEEFLPERWLPSAGEDASSPFCNDNRDVLQPFSIGPRNCIGRNLANAEMRMILARVLWNFDLELCAESSDWKEQRSFLLWEKGPLMCVLKKRKGTVSD